jgi:DNA repair and recombination protein RAD54B
LALKLARSLTLSMQYLKKKKADLAALGEWTHIDCLRIGAKNNIQDGILQRLIHDGDAATDKAKPNRSRLDSLLSMVDLDNPAIFNEDASRMSVRDVPGGTLSFLFEKVSESPMDRVEDDEE